MIVTKDYTVQCGLRLNVNKKNNKFGGAGPLSYIHGIEKRNKGYDINTKRKKS